MKNFYITFGQEHVNKYGDIILDNNIVVEHAALSWGDAGAWAKASFGDKHARVYSSMPNMEYYPRGIVNL